MTFKYLDYGTWSSVYTLAPGPTDIRDEPLFGTQAGSAQTFANGVCVRICGEVITKRTGATALIPGAIFSDLLGGLRTGTLTSHAL